MIIKSILNYDKKIVINKIMNNNFNWSKISEIKIIADYILKLQNWNENLKM